jgi:tyrosine-protein kinase Etk/Wzc
MALTGVVVFGAVAAYTLRLPETYQSTASFLVERRIPSRSTPTVDVLERITQANNAETEMELLGSRRVVEPVVDSLDLHVRGSVADEPWPLADLFEELEAGPEAVPGIYSIRARPGMGWVVSNPVTGAVLAEAEGAAWLDFGGIGGRPRPGLNEFTVQVLPFSAVVASAQGRIRTQQARRGGDVISMVCAAGSAEAAQELCAAVSNTYLSLRIELQRDEATAAARFLEEQAGEVEGRLRQAEDSLQDYQRRVQAVALEERAAQEVRQHVQLRGQREQLAAERSALAALILQIEEDEGGPRKYQELASFPTFLRNGNQVVAQLVESLVEWENRRNDLAVTRTEANPELAAVDQRIGEIQLQLRAVALSYEDALSAQIASLDEAIASSGQNLSSIPEEQVQTARLERQVSLLNELYSFLQTRLREAEVARAVDLPSVRVVDRAALPFGPSGPNRKLNFAMGLFLATGAALGVGLLRELTDSRVREREDVEEGVGIPVLAMLPRIPAMTREVSFVRSGGESGTQRSVALASKPSAERDLTLDAFQSLGVELRFAAIQHGLGEVRTLAITSPGRGEGKTFTACNLAVAQAALGRRTLLIDADLRAGGVARAFGLPRDTPGLVEGLRGSDNGGPRVRRLLIDDAAGMGILPAGEPTIHSTELLESDRFRDLVEEFRDEYDLIIIDTPPLGVLADAAAVGTVVDAVLVVVRGGLTEREGLARAVERLRRAKARVAGIVLNDVDPPKYYTVYSKRS